MSEMGLTYRTSSPFHALDGFGATLRKNLFSNSLEVFLFISSTSSLLSFIHFSLTLNWWPRRSSQLKTNNPLTLCYFCTNCSIMCVWVCWSFKDLTESPRSILTIINNFEKRETWMRESEWIEEWLSNLDNRANSRLCVSHYHLQIIISTIFISLECINAITHINDRSDGLSTMKLFNIIVE